MSILIKCMAMPKEQITAVINPNGLIEIIDDNNTLIEEHYAIELPPHGDLIDRDAVYKRIHKAIDDDPQLSDAYVEDARIVTEWLRTEPTIIESEE